MAKHRSAARRKGSLKSIGDILDGVYEGRVRRPLVRTFSWWDRTVAPRLARHARPVRLHKGTLVIHTKSAAWAQELSFFEQELLASVQRCVRSVRRLRIQVGPMPDGSMEPDRPPLKTIPLEPGELPGEVARALARVGDDGLRDTLTRAVCTSLAPVPEDESRPRRRARPARPR